MGLRTFCSELLQLTSLTTPCLCATHSLTWSPTHSPALPVLLLLRRDLTDTEVVVEPSEAAAAVKTEPAAAEAKAE